MNLNLVGKKMLSLCAVVASFLSMASSAHANIIFTDSSVVTGTSESTYSNGGGDPYGSSGHNAVGANLLTNDYLQTSIANGTATISAHDPPIYGTLNGLADATSSTAGGDVYLAPDGTGKSETVTIAFTNPSNLSAISVETVAATDPRRFYDYDLSYSTNGGLNYTKFLTAENISTDGNALSSGTGAQETATLNLAGVTDLQLLTRNPAGSQDTYSTSFEEIDVTGAAVAAVPEPASLSLLCLGSAGMLFRRRRGA